MSAHDGGPAFPTDSAHQNGPNTYHYEGMTLRDYFAAKAMAAALTSVRNAESLEAAIEVSAAVAYQVADAMLKAREAKP
ncbi:MAG: hypothetical protein ACK5PF_09670 [bacterium]